MESSKHPQIERFDISALPDRLRWNWRIYMVLRDDAREAYAYAAHPLPLPNDKSELWNDWHNAFDQASCDWEKANPIDPIWAGKWPKDAEVFLGADALNEARTLMEDAEIEKATPPIKQFDISALPDRLRLNYRVYVALYYAANRDYAVSFAKAACKTKVNPNAYRYYCHARSAWKQANPMNTMWDKAEADWPEGAHDNLGPEAVLEALRLLNMSEQSGILIKVKS